MSDPAPWEAVSYTDGSVFCERSTQPLRIRKMFCWGSHSGGRNWCDYLSVPGQGDYIEIQAGLAPTQLHGMDMEARSRIEFTQIFGTAAVQPGDGSLDSYRQAQSLVRQAVEQSIPASEVARMDADCRRLASRPCKTILHCGHGWGALENRRRHLEHKAPLPSCLSFPEESLGKEQELWLRLMEGHTLPETDGVRLPASWMTDVNYIPYLERYLNSHPGSVTGQLLLGVCLYENGSYDDAVSLWERCLHEKPLPILHRNLACAAYQEGNVSKAVWHMEQIPFHTYLEADYAYLQEYFQLLAKDGQWKTIDHLYQKLPGHLKAEERIYLLKCEAAPHLEQWGFLEEAFQKEYASIREGETKITDIWFAYARAHHIDFSKLPDNLDLRMF